MQSLHRGVWAEKLEDQEMLPVGGSKFNSRLTKNIYLNFSDLENLVSPHTPKQVRRIYESREKEFEKYLANMNSLIDPYLFFIVNEVQKKVQRVLQVNSTTQPGKEEAMARQRVIMQGEAKLTDFIGRAYCAEQSATGQYLLQGVLQEGYSSAFMSGVESQKPEEHLGDHSFIVLTNPQSETYIFDISRPRSGNNLPRLLRTDVLFTLDLFKDTDNLLVGATEVLQGGRIYYGVGNPYLVQDAKIVQTETTAQAQNTN